SRGCGFLPPAFHAGKTVCAVAHQSKIVGNGFGRNSELCDDSGLVEYHLRSTVKLDDSRTGDTLAEILVGSADQHAIDLRVFRGLDRRRGEGAVGFEFYHRPEN